MLTAEGLSTLTMYSNTTIARPFPCRNLNQTDFVAGVVDSGLQTRAYLYSAQGELLSLFIGGEKRVATCRCVSPLSSVSTLVWFALSVDPAQRRRLAFAGML